MICIPPFCSQRVFTICDRVAYGLGATNLLLLLLLLFLTVTNFAIGPHQADPIAFKVILVLIASNCQITPNFQIMPNLHPIFNLHQIFKLHPIFKLRPIFFSKNLSTNYTQFSNYTQFFELHFSLQISPNFKTTPKLHPIF